jgi:NAD(P)-dependent dehydrogenase (short-subunit alcohol dehydrogenase family)
VSGGDALAGRAAIVTGGAQGIGAAIARELHAQGAAVALLDLNPERGTATAAAIDRTGERARFIRCDVRDEQAVAAAVEQTVGWRGRLDVLVNNAGINAFFDAREMTSHEWDSVFAVDLKAAWLCAKHALPHLLAGDVSSIVNISSVHGRFTSAGYFPYGAAKAGIEGLTRSMALDYGPHGLRVNAVAPGWTRTQLVEDWLDRAEDRATEERRILGVQPLRRIADPAEIASVVAFLAGSGATAITGAVIPVDCGLSARFAD